MPRPQQNGPRKVKAAARRAQALALRIGGATYAQIGASLGISEQMAYRHVKKAMAQQALKLAEDVETYRALELKRLDALLMSLWSRRGEPRVADSIIRQMDRRAKLLGLDARVDPADDGSGGALQETPKPQKLILEVVNGAPPPPPPLAADPPAPPPEAA